MATRFDVPPTHTIKPMAPPPDSDRPTTAMLQADIDSGRTGDKNDVFDPALSPLGTDDEAAGHPPSTFRIALARRLETVERWRNGAEMTSVMQHRSDGFPVFFVSFILVVGLVLLLGIWKF